MKKVKDELAVKLGKLKKPILIIIDDIDRLTDEEVKTVFKLVKVNADFPNVVFLLLFQRDIVEKKLTTEGQDGKKYLEKIIQVVFNIPQIERYLIHQVLYKNLDTLLEQDKKILKYFDKRRWSNLYYGGFQNYFTNLRGVYRFISSLSFIMSSMNGEKEFEVNPVDLIGLECLRVFEPEIFAIIGDNKRLFTSIHNDLHDVTEEKEQLNSIIEKANNQEASKNIIKQLFPNIEYLLGGLSYSENFFLGWRKTLRICCDINFDRYFILNIPTGQVSNSELVKLIESGYEKKQFLEQLFSICNDRIRLDSMLTLLEINIDDIPKQNYTNIISALFDIGDELNFNTKSTLLFSAYFLVVHIITRMLKTVEEENERFEIIFSALEQSYGLVIFGTLLSYETEHRKENKLEACFFSDSVLDELIKIYNNKVAYLLENNFKALLANKCLSTILFGYIDFAKPAGLQEKIKSRLNHNGDFIKFVNSFISIRHTHGLEDYVPIESQNINFTNLEELIPYKDIVEYVNELNENDLNDSDKNILRLVKTEISKKEKEVKIEY